MKKFIVGCLLTFCGVAVPAAAQNYCCPQDWDPCCCDNGKFTGFYLGGNVGVLTHVAHRNDWDGFLTDNSGWTTTETGVAGGVQGGYDWQCGNRVLGILADWNATNIDRRNLENPNSGSDDNFLHDEFNWFTTIRARAGLAVCDTLIYVTGGAAVANFETRWNDDPNLFKHHHTRWGWTAGAGTEFFAWCKVSVGAEFLFMQFADRHKTFRAEDQQLYLFGHNDSAWNGRVYLNYRL